MALFWPKTSESFSSNLLWSAAKQVSTIVNCFVFGSYISTCLAVGPGSGKYFEYSFDPSLQNAGCCGGARVRAVSHTRPWLSIAPRRGHFGEGALGDPIGPVGVHLALGPHRLEVGGHAGARRSHRRVPIPLLQAGFVRPKILRKFTGRRVAHLMT